MLTEKQIRAIAIQETCLLEDYKKANNYMGVKIQEAKIELLDKILEIPKKEDDIDVQKIYG